MLQKEPRYSLSPFTDKKEIKQMRVSNISFMMPRIIQDVCPKVSRKEKKREKHQSYPKTPRHVRVLMTPFHMNRRSMKQHAKRVSLASGEGRSKSRNARKKYKMVDSTWNRSLVRQIIG
jgi:hypothetical protein